MPIWRYPEPLSIADVQSQLRDGEALVLFLDTPEVEADAGGNVHLGRDQDRQPLGEELSRHPSPAGSCVGVALRARCLELG